MYPKLYNSSGELQAVLDNIKKETANIKRVVNGEFTFTFEAYEKELKSEYFDPDNNLVVDEQTFDIKYIEQTHEVEVSYSIQCEHVNYRMEDGAENLYASYAYIGTPTEILTNILSGTEFSVGTVDFTDVITVSVNAEITRKALIYQLANLLGGKIDYTDQGFTINILDRLGQDNGFQVRFGKNLKGITKIIDTRGSLKTYYEVDLLELKNSNEYIEKQLQDLEVIGVGDTVQLIDEVIGLDVPNDIVSIEYNPVFRKNTKLEITNQLELITDKINQIETNAVQQDKLYNNVAISTEYGFRATRSDKLARATLGGGTISLDTGDGIGGYTPAMYFDVLSGKYKFVGDIEASGTITGADFIGGTINIGSGTFTVDALGNVIANSIAIGGGSGIGNFSDAGALATKDNVDLSAGEVLNAGDLAYLDSINGTYIDNNSITTPKIATGAVDATKINVSSLSAITANIGTITTGTLTGVNINANTFTAEDYVYIDTNNYDQGLYLSGFGSMYVRVYDPGGTLEIGPSVVVPGSLFAGGSQVITTAGNGLDKSGSTLDVDPIEIAGWGLQEDSSDNLEIDDNVVVTSTSGQNIRLQVYSGMLEFSLNGGAFTALQNF